MNSIGVLIVDDSALVRQVLREIIDEQDGLRVTAAAANPDFAERYMEKEWPDVIILDVEMPGKDGITFLKEIMAKRPTPVIICSSITEKNARETVEALSSGAVSVITKPKVGMKDFLESSTRQIIDEIYMAVKTDVSLLTEKPKSVPFRSGQLDRHTADVILPPPEDKRQKAKGLETLIVIGASAGGTQAIEAVLKVLPKDAPPIAIVQHMPEKFTRAFAERLDALCTIRVVEAEKNMKLVPGHAVIAMGNYHMTLYRNGNGYAVDVVSGPLVSRHRPSVDVLFRSAAKNGAENILGIILTGMGDDGAAGLLEMKNAGCKTIAQDRDTSIVYGMPKAAYDRGSVMSVLPLGIIPQAILQFSEKRKQANG
ncbi:MAG: protein-glutamate methylesterase/protein-glutamine glutaminase [Spirochaetota bacterium]